MIFFARAKGSFFTVEHLFNRLLPSLPHFLFGKSHMYYGPHLQVLLTSILVYSVSDLSHFDVDPEPVPKIHIWEKWIRIHLSVIVDPDHRIHISKKWNRIRIRVQSGSGSEYLFFIFFINKFMSDKFKYLFL